MNTKILLVLVAVVLVAGAAYFLVNGSSTSTGNPLSQSQVSTKPSDELNQLNSSDLDLNGMDSDLNSINSDSSSL